MTAVSGPDLIIVGQVTIDDVVPAAPGAWGRQIGGSSLYAVAGARHWIDPCRIGLVARRGRDYPFDIPGLLRQAGVVHVALHDADVEHLIEWIIYEEDGSRRSLPRNDGLRDVGGEGVGGEDWAVSQPYLDRQLAISPTAGEIPAAWLPAAALHLCPQAGSRHRDSLTALTGRVGWISVDPSPHYSRTLNAPALGLLLSGAAAFLPSAQEIAPLLERAGPEGAAAALGKCFAEVALKRGADPVIVAADGRMRSVPACAVAVIDPTGAGDAFCGAYSACRLLGLSPVEAAGRAVVSAALVVGTSGVEAALASEPMLPG